MIVSHRFTKNIVVDLNYTEPFCIFFYKVYYIILRKLLLKLFIFLVLQVHIKRQHQGVTYPCSICKENLSSPTAVRLHIKTVHEKRADMFCDKCE